MNTIDTTTKALAAAEDRAAAASKRTADTRDALDAAETAAATAEAAWSANETDALWQEVETARRARDQLRLRLRRVEGEERDRAADAEAARREHAASELAALTVEHDLAAFDAAAEDFKARAVALEREASKLLADMRARAAAGYQGVERAHEIAREIGAPVPADLPHWDPRAFVTICRKAVAVSQRIDGREGEDDGEVTSASPLVALSLHDGRWPEAERDAAWKTIGKARESRAGAAE